MTLRQIYYSKRATGSTFKPAIVLGFIVLALTPVKMAAQSRDEQGASAKSSSL